MERRALLHGVGGLASGLALAGCLDGPMSASGPRTPPQSPTGGPGGGSDFYVAEFDVEETDDGDLAVPVTVRNDADRRRVGTVVVRATVDDETYEGSQEVSVAPESSVSVTVALDVAYDDFVADGSLTVALE